MNKSKQIVLHALVWIALLGLFMYMASDGKIIHKTVVVFVYFGIINIIIFYINYLLILPSFLNRKKYLWCGIAMLILILLAAFVKCGLAYYFYDIIIKRNDGKHIMDFWDYFLSTSFVSSFFIFLSTVLKFGSDWFINDKIKSNLENEKLIAELAFLKSQINPHFLFNSLNNIYSLAYQKADKTPEAILKLSEIMRYMLYESNEGKVALSEEIRYLENYIELQKLRFKDDAYIKFEIIGEVSEQQITPLILISFVENAFKHGLVNDPENPVSIFLKIEPAGIVFRTTNKKSKQNKDDTGGIGLKNVRRRLDLIYTDRYKLHIEDKNDIYTCELYLNL